MHPINRRAKAMWDQIIPHVDFMNRTVIDIGAGYCDLAMMAADAGAHIVLCLENNSQVYKKILERLEYGTYCLNINAMEVDAEDFLYGIPDNEYLVDIAICTSVLPYLREPDRMLEWMSKHAAISIIEVQYKNDGPGERLGIEADAMMEGRLRSQAAWDSKRKVYKIGETNIAIRPGTRSIWLCRINKATDEEYNLYYQGLYYQGTFV